MNKCSKTLNFPGSLAGKESACNAGDLDSIPGLGRSPGGGHGNPLQCSCLENPHGQRSLVGYSPWNSPGQNTGVGNLSLLQGLFPTQGSNSSVPHCGQILYQLSHKGSPRINGVSSLCLLQWLLLTQESNQGLLHGRQIPYQLSYQRRST